MVIANHPRSRPSKMPFFKTTGFLPITVINLQALNAQKQLVSDILILFVHFSGITMPVTSLGYQVGRRVS